jgi:peptidoglycan/LPS O-acetylase OafA/YrhL
MSAHLNHALPQARTAEGTRKLTQLEAIRGIASVIVIVHHYAIAFVPGLKPALHGTPGAFLVNGEGAVTLFFVLSGFVLTRRYFFSGKGDVTGAALKRLPRLLVPAAFSTLIGYLILASGVDWYIRAGIISHSDWLVGFGGAGQSKGFTPSLIDALVKSVTVFFWSDQFQYNSNLWTMLPELVGSMFCFAYAAFALRLKNRFVASILLFVLAVTWKSLPWLAPFVLGIGLAQFLPRKSVEIGLWPGLAVMVLGVTLWCNDHYTLRNLGASMIIVVALICPRLAAALSGKVGSWLGQLSFPLYLVHTLVICSLSSIAYLSSGSVAVAAIVTIAFSLALAQPFVWLEGWWVPLLNRSVKRRQFWIERAGRVQTS